MINVLPGRYNPSLERRIQAPQELPRFTPIRTGERSLTKYEPLVSVLTVTKDRRRFIPQLLRQFEKQDYPNKELVIVASGALLHDLVPRCNPRIRLIHLDDTLGACRNAAVAAASGEYCVQFDDDDWQSTDRVSAQVKHLELSRKAVVGMFEMTFYREGQSHAWRVIDRVEHCAGAALAYRRDWAKANPFSNLASPFPEDTDFVTRAIRAGQFSNATGLDLLVMQTHADCDSGRGQTMPPDALLELSDNWRKIPLGRIAHILNG